MEQLPDPFLFLDGTRVKTKEDWARRRAEILELILHIQYGHLPEAPGNVKRVRMFGGETLNDGATRLEKHYLSMGPEYRIHARLDLYFPAKIEKPCPVFLNIGWNSPRSFSTYNERRFRWRGSGLGVHAAAKVPITCLGCRATS